MAFAKFLRKTRSEVASIPISDGQLLFETDQGDNSKIYMDDGAVRHEIGGKTDVIDNLTSTDTNDALSAKQGKVLKGLIDNVYTKAQSLSDNARMQLGIPMTTSTTADAIDATVNRIEAIEDAFTKVKLKEITLTSDTKAFVGSLSDIDFSEFYAIEIYADFNLSTTAFYNCYITFNDINSYTVKDVYSLANSETEDFAGYFQVSSPNYTRNNGVVKAVIYPNVKPVTVHVYQNGSYDIGVLPTSTSIHSLTSIKYEVREGSSYLLSGGKIYIYGVKL